MAGLFAVGLLVTGLALLLRPGDDPGPRSLPDRMVVACLETDQRSRLVAAAVALELADPGSVPDRVRTPEGDRTVRQWRDDRPADFRRACVALVEARSPREETSSGPGAWSGLLSSIASGLVPLVAGALLTAAATAWRRPLQLGTQLRERCRRLEEQVHAYLAQPSGERFDALRNGRRDLAEVLAQVRDLRPGWRTPDSLELLVASRGPLGDGLHDHYASKNDADRDRARAELDRIRQDIDLWARALGRPYTPHPALKEKNPLRRGRP